MDTVLMVCGVVTIVSLTTIAVGFTLVVLRAMWRGDF